MFHDDPGVARCSVLEKKGSFPRALFEGAVPDKVEDRWGVFQGFGDAIQRDRRI
jgi:hypothetical protein